MEPARGESCLSGQRRDPAAPGKDRVSFPDYKPFHIFTTPTTRGRKRRFPGSILPRWVWKPQPYWLVADWLGLVEPARDECFPSGQRRGPGAHEEVRQNGHETADPPGRYRSAWYGNPNPTGWLLIGWGSWSQLAARVAPLANAEVPLHPGRVGSHPQITNFSISL